MSATIDPTSALVAIDLQQGILTAATAPHRTEDVVRRTADLAAAFRAAGRAVVWVNVAGAPRGRTEAGRGRSPRTFSADDIRLSADLGVQPEDTRVTKHAWGAFTGTDLERTLRAAGVTQVVLTGVATSMGVESTARSAHELGFDVAVVRDAVADRAEEDHVHAVERVFPRLGEVTTSAEVLNQLGN